MAIWRKLRTYTALEDGLISSLKHRVIGKLTEFLLGIPGSNPGAPRMGVQPKSSKLKR